MSNKKNPNGDQVILRIIFLGGGETGLALPEQTANQWLSEFSKGLWVKPGTDGFLTVQACSINDDPPTICFYRNHVISLQIYRYEENEMMKLQEQLMRATLRKMKEGDEWKGGED